MATYNMPPDTSAKEKLIGGILDLTQLIFILVGLGIGLIIGFILKSVLDIVGLVFGVLLGIGAGAIFAFVKIKGMPLFSYFRYKKKHKLKTKKLPNVRKDGLSKEDFEKIRNY